ncbi:MAG: aspartate kinase [Deltaproteobacteria bacterium]|nr:aspartate kinase [Deltaproteobacteria bacterium]
MSTKVENHNPLESQRKPIVVQKYGGSSVADVACLRRVAQRVVDTTAAGFQVVVVVSAMGSTTDELDALARQVARVPEIRELDMLLSVGERISSALLAMAIVDLGQSAVSFTGSQCGIITSHRHTQARIIEVRPVRVLDELAQDRVVVVAGYQGMSYKREVTTLGRGGSDTTAVALAAALGAEYCEIFSDVDGVKSGDPAVVEKSHHLDQLNYDQMLEFSHFGARVLNAEAVAYARREGIRIVAAATQGGQTTSVDGQTSDRPLVGVTAIEDVVLIRCADPTPALMVLTQLLSEEQARTLWTRVERSATELCLVRGSCHDFVRFKRAVESALPAAEFSEPGDAVSVIGASFAEQGGQLTSCLAQLQGEGIDVLGADLGPQRLTVLVGAGQRDRVQRFLHRMFVEGV